MKKVIITGSSGMVGSLVLQNCLKQDDVSQITSIMRRKSGITHPKLIEVIHGNYLDYSDIRKHLQNQDVCFYCIGVYTGQVPKDEFRKITVDYTRAFAAALKENSNKTAFCFLSGQGADQNEKSRMMFAKDKGAAENILLNLKFQQMYIFRPGYIYPTVPRKEPNFSYKLMRILYKPVLSKIYPNIGVSSGDLAKVMVEIGLTAVNKVIFENKDIRDYLKRLK